MLFAYAHEIALFCHVPVDWFSSCRASSRKRRVEVALRTDEGGQQFKGGSVIAFIRQQSGASISISDPDDSTPTERVVTLQGSVAAISHALSHSTAF